MQIVSATSEVMKLQVVFFEVQLLLNKKYRERDYGGRALFVASTIPPFGEDALYCIQKILKLELWYGSNGIASMKLQGMFYFI